MHSAHALRPGDFRLERDGRAGPLDALWPGGLAPEDRLAVLLNEPMDPVGCANLVCATTTLFYEHLRATRGDGGFFRYPDTFLVGVGVPPGEFRRLDVWPEHKVLTVPANRTEGLLEALTDRRVTLLAVPEGGVRCRGPAEPQTWNALVDLVRSVVAYAPLTGRVDGGELTLVGNPVVESYVEHAIASTPGLSPQERAGLRERRRALDREPMVPAEAFRVLPGAEAAVELLGVTEVLPDGQRAP